MNFVFRNNTVEPFFPPKSYEFSGYDDISYIPENAERFIWWYQIPLNPDREKLSEEVTGYIDKLNVAIDRLPQNKTIIVLTLVNPFVASIVETDHNLWNAINNFNEHAYALAAKNTNIKILDFADFSKRFSTGEFTDWKFWFISQMPVNPKLAKAFKKWWNEKLNAIEMKRKKCIVLDLDNTLWGGILGEDGMDALKIGGDYPGKAFAWWQKALKGLAETGVILTICSKNNESDVKVAWEKNPFLILKEKDFAAWRINWQDKATNIQELAKELNIGLDSMVFIDDNPTERELVKQMLPMVAVPEFPSQPYQFPDFFNTLIDDYFQVYALTAEDLNKTQQYKANADRTREQAKFIDFDDYLRSLQITIGIEPVNEFNLSRIAQMTQKTNQFNLTTHRYTEADIHKHMADGWKIWCISVADKYGDNGITGCLMFNGEKIDTLLLSCRILGKKIEFEFVKAILNELKNSGVETLAAEYIVTAKNSQVADFYEKCGFDLIGANDFAKQYSIDLKKFTYQPDSKYILTIKP